MVRFFFRLNNTKVCTVDDASGKSVRQVISVIDDHFKCYCRKLRIFRKRN